MPPAESRAYVALGSNLGDPRTHVEWALETLAARGDCRVRRRSPWYRSTAIGPGTQDDYLNGVAEIDTTLEPLELLDALHAIEARRGRTRTLRWGPRTLDLDLLLYGSRCIDSVRLQVPHPRLHERNFVVYPLHDLCPQLVLPCGTALAALRAALPATGLAPLAADTDASNG